MSSGFIYAPCLFARSSILSLAAGARPRLPLISNHRHHPTPQVDKKLLGGFVLEFEDRLVDMSVAKKLEEFNNLVFKLEADLRP